MDRLELEHAWAWFSLHAGQRMQLINFLLVSVALATAGYATALGDERFVVAGFISTAGALICLAFWRLDLRTKSLVHLAEVPLRRMEAAMSERSGYSDILMVEGAEKPERLTSYSSVIRTLMLIAGAGFLAGAFYAFGPAENSGARKDVRPGHHEKYDSPDPARSSAR